MLRNKIDLRVANSLLSLLSTQHSAPSTQPSAPSTQHSALSTQHSALSTRYSVLEAEEGGAVFGEVGEGLEEEAEVDCEEHQGGHDYVWEKAGVHVFLFG